LLDDQAQAIGSYINGWMRRVYPSVVFPEWSTVAQATPVNHIVPYSISLSNSTGDTVFAKVVAVYLVDPRTTDSPAEIDFEETSQGIHVGYDHGTNVWIRYIPETPIFTAQVWDSGRTYAKKEVTYSPRTGECYRSKISNNIGHDPAVSFTRDPAPILVEETQPLIPADRGLASQTQIIDVYVQSADGTTDISDPIPVGDEFTLGLFDTSGGSLAGHSQTQSGTDSIATMLAAFKTMFDGDALPGFTFTVVAPNNMRIESTTTEFVIGFWNYLVNGDFNNFFPVRFVQVQPFSTGLTAGTITPQQLKLTVGDDSLIPGSIYTVTITDIDGVEHSVQYQSVPFDNKLQILNGILLAMGLSPDITVNSIGTSLNTSEPSATLSLIRSLGVSVDVSAPEDPDAPAPPPSGAFWQVVPFPEILVDAIVRGATGDVLKEWGQTDKGSAEEGQVPQEVGTRLTTGREESFDTFKPRTPNQSRYAPR
jgi:hypothetical protein